jgi:predicted amino acid racemase
VNRVVISPDALRKNYRTVKGWVERYGASLTVVTKALCGHLDSIRVLKEAGVESMGDSRLENLKLVTESGMEFERWFLRPPHTKELAEVIAYSDISLNTELKTVKNLNVEAEKQDKIHKVILMVELGDLREGILPGSLVKLYEDVFVLPNIEILGIGSNLGCISGTVPSADQLMQLVLYRELLELKFDRKLPLISAGSSATLPFLLQGTVPSQINHFRVGEAILLGTDLINGGIMRGLRDDGFLLEAEIVEIKEKSLMPVGETLEELIPFNSEEDTEHSPGQRGYRALVTVGELDTEVSSLRPVNPDYRLAGASSDLTVLNVGEDGTILKLGDSIRFRMGYSGLVRLMNNKYTGKVIAT